MERKNYQKRCIRVLTAIAVLCVLYCIAPGISTLTAALDQSAAAQQGESPAGYWQGVDYVRKIEEFVPGHKSWPEDLFLKELSFFPDGRTSIGWAWKDGNIIGDFKDVTHNKSYFIKTLENATYLFFPWLPSIGGERTEPAYYVLKKVSNEPKNVILQSRFDPPVEAIGSVNSYQDVRWKDMGGLDLSGRSGLLNTLTYNDKTVWPEAAKMPDGEEPSKILEKGKNPGLGVRELHRQGITGKGVAVAIIDQPLYPDHPEYINKIAAYHDVGCNSASSMHGPGVTSLLAGTNCGTAPEVKLYFAAAPSWTKDTAFQAKALDWIIEQNEKVSSAERIRVVSVSGAPSGQGSPFTKNQAMWDEACARAEAADILVLDCTRHRGFIYPCYYDSDDPENVSKCKPGFPGSPGFRSSTDKLLVPSSPRTTAEEYNEGECSYQYCGRGGLSWAIPWCAGVLALGWQIRPELTPQQMKDLLFQSAYIDADGNKYLNPPEFIRMVQASPAGVRDIDSPGSFRLNSPYPNPQKTAASGAYFLRLDAGGRSQTRKLTLLR